MLYLDKSDRPSVQLYKPGEKKRYHFNVAKLVAQAFVEPYQGVEVQHKDGDVRNCRAENLIWCSDAKKLSRNWSKKGKFSLEDIKTIRSLKDAGWRQAQIAKKFHTSQGYISELLAHYMEVYDDENQEN